MINGPMILLLLLLKMFLIAEMKVGMMTLLRTMKTGMTMMVQRMCHKPTVSPVVQFQGGSSPTISLEFGSEAAPQILVVVKVTLQ